VTSPEPYYQDEFCTIYHGDCREILPSLGPVDLVLADPPYGMKYKPLRGADGSKRWVEGVRGDDESFNPSHLVGFGKVVLFGANWYADRLPISGGWIVWDKTPRGVKDGFHASHAELAWTNCASSVSKFSLQWGGEARNSEGFFHPTQKPVALMRWVIERFTEPGQLVVDPYMGSGPCLVAAKDLGRKAIGIEIEERYCEIAARRLAQEVLAL
jgi:DNA modification methylase